MAAERIDPNALPSPSPDPLALRLTPPAERAVRGGHPWVFGRGVRSASRSGGAGDLAVIFDRKNRFLAVGLYEPEGPIRVRILAAGAPTRIGPSFLRRRLAEALARRAALQREEGTTGYRLVHGEGDGLGGVVLDRYGEAAVLKLYTPAWLPWLRELVPAIHETLAARPLVALASRRVASDAACPPALRRGATLMGAYGGGGLPFREASLAFEAHPRLGHKTGFYLDQRENRGRVGRRSAGARVLNVFSYTGAFSVHAARGGARQVTSVDLSRPALTQAERHFDLNREQLGDAVHRTVQGDAFEVMAHLAEEGERFDLVLVDPPSFAHQSGQREGALRAYAALTRLAVRLLVPGGRLVQASCSSRVEPEAFFARVLEAARGAGRPLTEEARTGHPIDHPIGFPEGVYLKCLHARAA